MDYIDREYDAGTQYAERLNTAAINATVLDLPIVMTSAEAAGKAGSPAVPLLAGTAARRDDQPAANVQPAWSRAA